MRRLAFLILGMLIGGGFVWGSLSYHFVRSDEGLLVVPKRTATWRNSFPDIREWRWTDFRDHGDVTQALVDNGHGNLVKTEIRRSVIDDVLQILTGPPGNRSSAPVR